MASFFSALSSSLVKNQNFFAAAYSYSETEITIFAEEIGIAKEIVVLHGGSIEAASENYAVTITVRLPKN